MNRLGSFIAAISFCLAACRPVFAIGWGEILILTTLIIILIGPLLLRIYRTWQKYDSNGKKDEEIKN